MALIQKVFFQVAGNGFYFLQEQVFLSDNNYFGSIASRSESRIDPFGEVSAPGHFNRRFCLSNKMYWTINSQLTMDIIHSEIFQSDLRF